MAVSTVKDSSGCRKCAANKAGKFTCCARGGAWFKKCGDVGETKFDHTWIEGVQACTGFVTPVSVTLPLKAVPRRVGIFVFPRNVHQPRNNTSTQQQKKAFRTDGDSNAGIKHFEHFVGATKVVTFVYILFLVSTVQT